MLISANLLLNKAKCKVLNHADSTAFNSFEVYSSSKCTILSVSATNFCQLNRDIRTRHSAANGLLSSQKQSGFRIFGRWSEKQREHKYVCIYLPRYVSMLCMNSWTQKNPFGMIVHPGVCQYWRHR